MRHSSPRTLVLLVAVLGLRIFGQSACPTVPVVSDSWSSTIDIMASDTSPGGDFLAPIHVSLMPDGSVMVFGWRQNAVTITPPTSRLYSFSAVIGAGQLGPSPSTPTSLVAQVHAEPVVYQAINPPQIIKPSLS